jgi:Fe-S-cluster containining protein
MFTTESDDEIALIPDAYAGLSGMRCVGARCSALEGEIGVATACAVYAVRPEVCRVCEPGDEACTLARRRCGMPRLEIALS